MFFKRRNNKLFKIKNRIMANNEIKVEHFDGFDMLVLNRPLSLNSITTQVRISFI